MDTAACVAAPPFCDAFPPAPVFPVPLVTKTEPPAPAVLPPVSTTLSPVASAGPVPDVGCLYNYFEW